ncbi:MAG: sigma factor-like helix-turn-helix DNA-binding protein [Patescibacteria group bacterium]
MSPALNKPFEALFEGLLPKQKEVIFGRFGLDKGGEEKTLASIGEKLNLTRERVRQIEKSALDVIRDAAAKSAIVAQLLSRVKREISAVGGAMGKEELLKTISGSFGGQKINHLDLLSEATGAFHAHPEDDRFRAFYYLKKEDLKSAMDFIDGWKNYLNQNKEKVLSGSYQDHFKNFIRSRNLERKIADNFLHLSKLIHENAYGDMGLAAWPEIRPATTRDRAYLVLRKKGEPLHFEELTKEINEAKLSPQLALAPTVHNELIKDTRFVLVGRGTYALREQGYEPGIARDVIKRILRKNGPLGRDEIVELVNKERFLKPNTIAINLQSKSHFERTSDGRYRVREA